MILNSLISKKIKDQKYNKFSNYSFGKIKIIALINYYIIFI